MPRWVYTIYNFIPVTVVSIGAPYYNFVPALVSIYNPRSRTQLLVFKIDFTVFLKTMYGEFGIFWSSFCVNGLWCSILRIVYLARMRNLFFYYTPSFEVLMAFAIRRSILTGVNVAEFHYHFFQSFLKCCWKYEFWLINSTCNQQPKDLVYQTKQRIRGSNCVTLK